MIINGLMFSVILGSAFDLIKIPSDIFSDTKQIFNLKEINANLEVTPKFSISSGFLVPKNASQIDAFLDVDPALSLLNRKGDIELLGLHNYLKNVVDRERTVEILMRVYVEIENNTFPSTVSTETGWRHLPQKDVGTHYIKSTMFGGQLLISYRLNVQKSEDIDFVRRTASKRVGNSGALDDNFFSNLQLFVNEVIGKCTWGISISGSIEPAFSVDGMKKLVNSFPEDLKTGKSHLQVIKVDLVDLSTVQSNYTTFSRNDALTPVLKEANDKFDDIRAAFDRFDSMSRYGLDDDQKKMDDDLGNQLQLVRQTMLEAIKNLDITGSKDQFNEAFKVYNSAGDNVPYRYLKEVSKLEALLQKKV